MDAPIFASTLFGARAVIDGEAGRLADLGVVRSGGAWRIVAFRTHRRAATLTGWSPGGVTGTEAGAVPAATWLREALFDRQIVDLEGKRVIRIGDVVLASRDDRLEVTAVEVGAAAIFRRLGFGWLAARLEPQLLPIDRLHLPSEAAGALLLDTSREQFERLDEDTVTGLLARLPVPVAEHAVEGSRHRDAVAGDADLRRRRHRYPRTPA